MSLPGGEKSGLIRLLALLGYTSEKIAEKLKLEPHQVRFWAHGCSRAREQAKDLRYQARKRESEWSPS